MDSFSKIAVHRSAELLIQDEGYSQLLDVRLSQSAILMKNSNLSCLMLKVQFRRGQQP